MNKYILIVVLNDSGMICTKHETMEEVFKEIKSYNEDVVHKFGVYVRG